MARKRPTNGTGRGSRGNVGQEEPIMRKAVAGGMLLSTVLLLQSGSPALAGVACYARDAYAKNFIMN